jgi:hypothetical protein
MMTKFYRNQFFWISLGFTALVAWGFVIAQKTESTTSTTSDVTRSEEEKTLERAMLVGRHLIDSGFVRKVFTTPDMSPKKSRNLASTGEAKDFQMQTVEAGQTGRDSWGYPFSYIKKNSKLFIVSPGPNHILDSSLDRIDSDSSVANDDLVVTIAI